MSLYNSSLLVNKELGYLLLSKEWPTVYESQLNKKIPWLERKTKRKKKVSQKVAEQKETKRNKAGHQ